MTGRWAASGKEHERDSIMNGGSTAAMWTGSPPGGEVHVLGKAGAVRRCQSARMRMQSRDGQEVDIY